MRKEFLIWLVCVFIEALIMGFVSLALNLLILRFMPHAQVFALFVSMFSCVGTGLYLRFNHLIKPSL